MKTLHIANTDFEYELRKPSLYSLKEAWSRHLYCLQLQFLPLLYAQSGDIIAITEQPDYDFINQLSQFGLWKKNDLPQFVLLEDTKIFPECNGDAWGASPNIQKWMNHHHISYAMPPWDLVKEINSKAFSTKQSHTIPSDTNLYNTGALIANQPQLTEWLAKRPTKSVLKTCFGVSGRGHFFIDPSISKESIETFCQKEWEQQRPIIAEPWLNRILDFSTQWFIDDAGALLLVGSTICKNDSKGSYCGTVSGPESLLFGKHLPFLYQHITLIKPILEKIAKSGFYGNLGVDAFLYLSENGNIQLRPLVEINARKTLSFAIHQFQQRWFPQEVIQVAFQDTKNEGLSLLPIQLGNNYFKNKLSLALIKPQL